MRRLSEAVVIVAPEAKVDASPDDADNRFLECAQAARAHFLVTGNLRHFPVRYRDTRVVTCRQLLDTLRLEENC